jgi:hypothetical protein
VHRCAAVKQSDTGLWVEEVEADGHEEDGHEEDEVDVYTCNMSKEPYTGRGGGECEQVHYRQTVV